MVLTVSRCAAAGLFPDDGVNSAASLANNAAIELDNLFLGRSDYIFKSLIFLTKWIDEQREGDGNALSSIYVQMVPVWVETLPCLLCKTTTDLAAILKILNDRLKECAQLREKPSGDMAQLVQYLQSLCLKLSKACSSRKL